MPIYESSYDHFEKELLIHFDEPFPSTEEILAYVASTHGESIPRPVIDEILPPSNYKGLENPGSIYVRNETSIETEERLLKS